MTRSSIAARLLRWPIGLIALAFLFGQMLSGKLPALRGEEAPAGNVAKKDYENGVLIRFETEMIEPLYEASFYRKLDAAQRDGADLLIVEIECPGGLVAESFAIAERLSDIKWAHTVAYIPDYALSGAAIMALGCDEIIMAPRAQLGDAGMIFIDEENLLIKYVEEKALSPAVARIRELAASKGRSPALAEAMMRHGLEVYQYKHRGTGELRYMTDADVRAAGRDEWEQGKLVIDTKKGQFLTVSGNRAVELGLAQATAADRDAVVARYDVADRLTIVEQTSVDRFVEILNNPWVTGLLFVIGIVSLYIEFSAPGIGVAGLFSLLCFGLFFWSRFLGGTAEMLEIMLFLAGVAFVCVEMFVLPGFGIAGLTGILLMLASVVLASLKFTIPQGEHQVSKFIESMMVMTGSGVASIGAIMFISRYFKSLPFFSHLALPPPAPDGSASQAPASPIAAGASSLTGAIPLAIGTRGTAETPLRPAGKMRLGDRLIDVVTDNEYIEPGSAIEVAEIHASRVVVREVRPA